MHRTLILASLSVVFFAGADWTRLRGPECVGVSEDTGLPTTWSATENVVWKTALPGYGASSPITLGDKIFLTCYSGYGLNADDPGNQENLLHHVVCLDRSAGNVIWERRSAARLPEQDYTGFMQLHGYASSTPATDGEAVYVFFGRSGVSAYTLDGEPLWSTTAVGSDTHGWGSANSPVLTDELVIINASVESQSLCALDKKNGEIVWKVPDIDQSWSTPVVVDLPDGKQEIVVSMKGKIIGVDPTSGEQLWECIGVQDYVVPSVVAKDGIVYVTGGRSAARIFAIRAGGRGDVSDTHILWQVRKTSKVSSPLIHEGLLYMVDQAGKALCLKADTGEILYEERMEIEGSRDRVYASPVLADGKIYVVSRQGGTIVLATGPEFKELARNDLGDESVFNGTPVISNGQLLLRSDKYLYCIGK